MALTDKLTYIADAVRSKTGEVAELSLKEIEATIRGSLGVNPTPSYIVTEAQRVAGLVNSSNFNIVGGADIHLYSGNSTHDNSLVSAQYAGMGIKEVQKRTSIDATVLVGDYSYMYPTSYTTEQTERDIILAEKALDIDGEKILCLGNHDWTYGTGVDRMFTADEVYNLIGSKSDGVKPTGNDLNRCYGYLDFEEHKVRVVYLNTNDCKDGIANGGITKDKYGNLEMISPAQFRWVADVALKFTESGWGVVFVSHHNLDYGYNWFKQFLQMLEAYKDGKNLTLWLTEYIVNGQYTGHNETFNFANTTNRAEIICNIHGHNHNCAERKISSSDDVEDWLWCFCVPNMCANRYNESATVESRKYMGEFDESGNPVYWRKETGNAKATSFNVISIDRTNKIINAYIFGAGRDRSMYYGEYIPVEYSITTTLTNIVASTSNPTTITEGLSASLVFTANSGYELPDSVTVTGASYTWDKTSGTLSLSNPTGNVSIVVTAVEIELPYTNLITTVGYTANTRLVSGGATETRSGCGTTGFIEVPAPTSHSQGQIVFRIQNAEITVSNTSLTRIALYDADKNNLAFANMSSISASSYTNYKVYYEVDSNSYVTMYDLSTYVRTQINNGLAVKYVRFCGAGIDGDTIITLNEPIV